MSSCKDLLHFLLLAGYGPHADRDWFLARDLPAVLEVDKCRRYCQRTRREYEVGAYPKYSTVFAEYAWAWATEARGVL